jgi:hypothetical protein
VCIPEITHRLKGRGGTLLAFDRPTDPNWLLARGSW